MTVFIAVTCPDCHSTDIVKHGKSGEGKQRYRCRNQECLRRTFLLDYSNPGSKRSVKKKIADMSVNGSGVRDTARVLKISTSTVIKELKKQNQLQKVNKKALKRKNLGETIVEIVPFKVEMDEMQSFVGKKSNHRWLWHGIDHSTGEVLAYVLGSRTDEMFLKLKKLLEPFGITQFYTDGLKTYERYIDPKIRQVSKYKMQKIERKHLSLRTRIKRLARKSICFSKLEEMHDIVIGLYINKYEFGLNI